MFFLNIAYFIYHWKIYRRGKFTGGENLQEGKIYRRKYIVAESNRKIAVQIDIKTFEK
jgi:hypothetical protein